MVPIKSFTTLSAVASGTGVQLTLAAPQRGRINRLHVLQTSGALDGYTYALYDSSDAFTSSEALSESAELHRVTPTVTVAGSSAQAATESRLNLNYAYTLLDRAVTDLTGQERLYLWLVPAGSGAKDYRVALTCLDTSPNP